eukprot:403344543
MSFFQKKVAQRFNKEQPPQETLEQKFHTYYCAVCGQIALVMSHKLEDLKLRRTDDAMIVEVDQHFHKKLLQRQPKFTVLHRENGIEKQFRWKCKECQIVIGYQCSDFQEGDEINGPGTKGKDAAKLHEEKEMRRHFYIKQGALVSDTQDSELLSRVKEMEEQMQI